MTTLYPVFLRLQGLRCVIIGGGRVAARKIQGLLDAGAVVTVVSPTIDASIQAMPRTNRLEWIQRDATDDDVTSADLAFLATSNGDVNTHLERVARAAGVFVNRADSPDDGSFHVPAVLRRGDVTVAVSTSGRSPGIAQLIRDDIESVVTNERVALLDAVGEARHVVHAEGISTSTDHWRELIHDDAVLAHVQAGRRDQAVQYLISRMRSQVLARSAQ